MGHFGALYPAYIYLCRTLRARPHDRPRMTRGQDGFATPFLYDSFIHYSTPVYPDAPQVRPASFVCSLDARLCRERLCFYEVVRTLARGFSVPQLISNM